MSLYGSFRYGQQFYGSNIDGFPPGGLVGLSAYQNIIDTAMMYWALSPCSVLLDTFTWAIETDLVDTFASPDYRLFISSDRKIAFSAELVVGNTYSVTVDGTPITVPYAVSHDDTMAAIAAAIAGVGTVGLAWNEGLTIGVRALAPEAPIVLTASAVTGGISQATTTIGPYLEFVNGRLHRGMVVPIYPRAQGVATPMYWKAWGLHGGIITPPVPAYATFQIPSAIDGLARDAMMDLFSDVIYRKDSGSNIYKMHQVYGDALDGHHVANIFAENNNSTALIRDQMVEDVYGAMVEIIKPQLMPHVDYHEIIRTFLREARNTPTMGALIAMIRSIVCIPPTITAIRETLDFFVNDSASSPTVDPFYVSDASPVVDPPTMWSVQEIGNGIIVTVYNDLGAIVDAYFVSNIVNKMIPAHVTAYVTLA